ncbi:uncharacterized protein LOC111346088 isoform X5 [Stylophora pistillata]|uniref:uncharacterized protein LOC111346088 isoform X5 n=1 Tax=Stylophora pistillata TaxID=50429 RepID=UPI000C04011D|nr:uncharacterized protein LOC111346088 isoform X5 [Stylophora pistillata]
MALRFRIPLEFDVVLQGSSSVGKSSLFDRCVYGRFPDFQEYPMWRVEFVRNEVYLRHGMLRVQLRIWDCPHLEMNLYLDFYNFSRGFVALVLYDITQRCTFESAKEWVDIFSKRVEGVDFVALVGSKADLESRREVSSEEAQSYADGIDIIEIFMEVSAMSGENVEDLFCKVAERLTAAISVIDQGIATRKETLDLSNRNLYRISRLSSLPESMKCLVRLRELDLRNNQLKELGVVRELSKLEKLFVEGNPLRLEEIRSLVKHVDRTKRRVLMDIAAVAPSEILAKGHSAKIVYEKALRDGFVNVYRGRIVLVGQDRAGKTSLKKTLLGLPFDFKEQSTDGIEIEPSKFEIEVDQIKNWTPTSNKSSLSECSEYKTCIAKMLATERYHTIVGSKKEDSRMNSTWAQPKEERKVESEKELITKDAVADEVFLKEDSATKFADRSSSSEIRQGEKGKSSDYSMTPSRKFEMGINATALPNAVKKHADQLLKNMVLEGVDVESKNIKEGTTITADVWDFAGQHLYYAAHPVFLSSRAVYIVVHNLSKPLNAQAQPCVRQGTHEVTLENPNNETNLENLLSWLMTVRNMRPTGEEKIETSNLPYLRPPVFIVGTHADKPCEDTKDVTSKIHREISSKEFGKHVIRPFFCIDNTQAGRSFAWKIWNFFTFRRNCQTGQEGDNDSTSASGIHALRARILEILQQEPYMGEKIPVRWFNFEKVIESLVAENVYHTNIANLQTYAKDVCFIEDDEQFHTMLSFYHDLGMIVRHRNTVILKVQWLVSLFKKLVTIPPFKKADPVHSKYWLELERSGVLKMELVDHVFSTLIQQGVNKEDILDMMEQFGLIAKYSPSLADVKYFVPCQLRSSPKELCDMVPSPTDPCPLYLHFQEGFVPHGLFTRLVSKSVSWCCANGSSQEPKLYQNGAWFVLEGSVMHDMILICKKNVIKILLRQRTEDEAVPVSHSASEEVARSVRLFVEKVLEKMSEEFPYLSRLQYEFCVECPYCRQGSRQCTNHKQVSCAEDDCLHLLELKQGQNLICMESMSEKVLRVSGQEKWFLNQVLAPSVINTSQAAPVGGHPAKSNKAMRVTLLANEWNSSVGGLSTINRQLAILLAKRTELEVSLLVPQSACSEEEKRAAQSHKIVIKEAERRPGFDPLDWLSFPPKDLVIDVVVGHGAKLGKQAQIIRKSHCCQWIQVVHTAPEELGMFKNAARAVVELKENAYHLIFVGAPEGKQEAVMENLLQSGILRRQLTVRKFLQSKEKLKECFCEVDLCIMPSRTEGFGLTALEALSAGLPILVSGNSGLGDALRTVPSGKSFVVDSEDPKVWAEAIAGVRKKKRAQRLQDIERLRAAYEEHFSWEKQCDLLVDKMWHKVYGAGLLDRIIQNLQRMQLCASKVESSTNLTEELTAIVTDKGFRISNNPGSGNCMFQALSEQLETVNGIKILHGQLRRSLVQYLEENPKLPDGTDLSHFVHGHETWVDYLTCMKQDGAWGDHLILCAAANCFKTCIHVVSSLHNDVVIRPHCHVDESKPLVLGHIHEVHYVSLQPIQG